MNDCKFRKAERNEFNKCTDLANFAFGIEFRTLLPKVFGDHPAMSTSCFVADNGELLGLVAVMEDSLTVAGTVLKTGFIGSVCVHPDAREQGIMRKLMELANDDMTENGTDIAFLNGSRQRYQYYGFSPAGATYTFNVNGGNVAHALKEVSADGVTFEEIQPGSTLETEAGELYRSRTVHFARKEFAVLCRSYKRRPYAVLDGGCFIGYVVTDESKNCWTEVCVRKTNDLDAAVKAWMTQNDIPKLQIYFPEWEHDLRLHLACYASGMSRGHSVQARIFRFRRVAEAYLRVKALTGSIADGRMAFDIDRERFEITVTNGEVTVRDGGDDPTVLTSYEANMLMLMPAEYEGQPKAPLGWFPLGVYVAPGAPDAF